MIATNEVPINGGDVKELSPSTLSVIRDLGRESLFFLAYGILGFSDLDEYIHKPICQEIQDYENNTRLLIVLPRDWFKSTVGSVAYPIWRGVNDPDVRVLVVQNSFSNACKKLQAIKQLFEKSKLLRSLYPEVLPTSSCTWTKECLTLNREGAHPEGTFEAAGTGTAVTSRHYGVIIEDDTVSPEKDALTGILQYPTQYEIEKAIGWHRVAYPLLLHPTRSQRIVIGTRWAERDLIGWVIENSPEYKLLSRSGREVIDGKLQPIWDRYPDEVLDQIERDVGPYMFSTLFMNMPVASINQVFRREGIRYYDTVPQIERALCCTSVDPAASDMESSSDPDYNIVMTTTLNPLTGEVFIREISRARMNPGELINEILRHQAAYSPMVVKIESIAYQRTLNYWLRQKQEKLGRYFYVEEVKSYGRTSKEDRIRALQPFFANGLIRIGDGQSELERELLAFPNGAHDDIIDALSMQVGFWTEETEAVRREKERVEKKNPFSGAALLEELMGRANEAHQYPYDMGLMGERLEQPREYEYEDSYI